MTSITKFSMMLGTAVAMFASVSQATIVQYQLGDHPDAALYSPLEINPLDRDPYGLRIDSFPPPGSGPTFSVNDNLESSSNGGPVILSWDDANLSAGATITGSLQNNFDESIWTVNYSLTGLVSDGNGGFTATGSVGTITDNLNNDFVLTGLQNNQGYAFIFANDGHRLGASSGWVGRGWLLDNGQTDDWLVTGVVVPLPAAFWLFGSALAGIVGLRRIR